MGVCRAVGSVELGAGKRAPQGRLRFRAQQKRLHGTATGRRDATHSPQQARTPHAELRTPRGRTSPARTPRDPPPAGPVRSPAAPPVPLRRRLPPRAVPSPLPPPPASPRRGCGRGERGPPTAAPTLLPTAGSGRSRRDSPVAVAEPRSRRRAAAPRAFPPPRPSRSLRPGPMSSRRGGKRSLPGRGKRRDPGSLRLPPPRRPPPAPAEPLRHRAEPPAAAWTRYALPRCPRAVAWGTAASVPVSRLTCRVPGQPRTALRGPRPPRRAALLGGQGINGWAGRSL